MNILVLFVVFFIFFVCFIVAMGDSVVFLMLMILAIALILALVYRNISLKKTITKVAEKELHVLNLDKGGILRLTGVGPNSDEINLKVLAKHLYRQGDYYWYELECDKGDGEKIWLEIEDDDETEVSVVLEKLTLHDIGLASRDLDNIDEYESGYLNFRGERFVYTDSDEAVFYRFCDDAKAENLYYWDFEKGSFSIGVERWGNRDYEVFYCQKMKPSQITVYLNNSKGE